MTWTLYILVMSATFQVASSSINFATRDLCQQAQQGIVQQLTRLSPQPQFQTICMKTAEVGEKIQ